MSINIEMYDPFPALVVQFSCRIVENERRTDEQFIILGVSRIFEIWNCCSGLLEQQRKSTRASSGNRQTEAKTPHF